MSEGYIRNFKSDITNLNSVLSKVKLKKQDIPLELRPHKTQANFKEKTAMALVNPSEIRQPIRKMLSEQRASKSLANPSSVHDINYVKTHFNLPNSKVLQVRQLGKTKYSHPKPAKRTKPTILPKQFRDNPLAEPPPITEKDVESGILSLIHRGLIPKDVDVTPAFERGFPPLQMKMAKFHDWRDMAPPPPIISTNANLVGLGRLEIEKKVVEDEENLEILALVPIQNEVKTFEQVVDSFSMHQIMIRKGKIQVTPEYQSFRRVYSEQWGDIFQALTYAEEVFSKFMMPMVYINGKKLVGLVKDELRPVRLEELLTCVMNSNNVLPLVKSPSHKFKSFVGEVLAAVKIQAMWKRFKAFSAFKKLKILIRKSVVIQNCVRNWRRKTMTREIIKKREESFIKAHQAIQKTFEAEYSQYKNAEKTEIHLCSSNDDITSLINPEVLQNSQINRVFSIKNPLISVILITSKLLTEEIKNYYYRILEIGGINNPKSRITFIHSDILSRYNLLARTSALLYFSSNTLKQIRKLVEGKKAYIMTGKMSLFDVKVSVLLNIPIFSGEYTETSRWSSKSDLKSLFQLSDLPIPYSEVNISNEKVFYQKLALLIIQYSEIETWLFKFNLEESSRGLAYFEVSNLKIILEIRKRHDLRQVYEVEELIQELKSVLPLSVKFVMPTLHKNWNYFLSKFTRYGGVIQATPMANKAYITFPVVSFMIDPVGEKFYINSGDCLHSYQYMNAAMFTPQLSLSQEDVIKMLNGLCKVLFSKKLYGYFTLQLVAFIDPYSDSMKPVPWAVDLSFGMNRTVSSYLYFHFLMGGTMDPTSGKYFMQCIDELEEFEEAKHGEANIYHIKDSPRKSPDSDLYSLLPSVYNGENPVFQDFNLYDIREYLFCWEMWHPDLVVLDLKTLFHLCRYEGISYDLEHGRGITFVIYDLLRFGYLGCMCISSKRDTLMSMISRVFSFLAQHAGPAPPNEEKFSGKEFRPLSELILKIRIVENKQGKGRQRKRALNY